MTSLTRFSWRMTAALYAAVLLFLVVALTLSPGAINAVLGIGIVAVVLTVLSVSAARQERRQEAARADLAANVPDTDPMTICPVCHLMGVHSVERVPGTGRLVRHCAFYPEQHVWGVPR